MGKIRSFWKNQNTLERKLFWSILMVVFAVATCSAVFTIYEGLNLAASLCSAGCAGVCVIVAIVAVRTSLYDQCFLVMCSMLSWFLLPLLFLFCGGITSGMPLYFIAGTSLIAFAKAGVAKRVVFGVTLCLQAGLLIVTWKHQELVVTWLEYDAAYLDILVSLVLTSVTLFAVGTISMGAYAKERATKEELLAKLDNLSMRDPLTGVYNSRYLNNFIANEVWLRRDSFFLLLLDVDGLERLNNSYGHVFGDGVLMAVANLLDRRKGLGSRECVARLGGGTFACVLTAESEGAAMNKAESLRREVSALRFEENTLAQVTVSGGFVSFGDREINDSKRAMVKADELMRVAKSLGKNQIRNLMNG